MISRPFFILEKTCKYDDSWLGLIFYVVQYNEEVFPKGMLERIYPKDVNEAGKRKDY